MRSCVAATTPPPPATWNSSTFTSPCCRPKESQLPFFSKFPSSTRNVSLNKSLQYSTNFRVSKFSRIAIFEEFIEIILRIHCTRTLHAVCQKFSLKYFRERLKICKIKDPRKFSAIRNETFYYQFLSLVQLN